MIGTQAVIIAYEDTVLGAPYRSLGSYSFPQGSEPFQPASAGCTRAVATFTAQLPHEPLLDHWVREFGGAEEPCMTERAIYHEGKVVKN